LANKVIKFQVIQLGQSAILGHSHYLTTLVALVALVLPWFYPGSYLGLTLVFTLVFLVPTEAFQFPVQGNHIAALITLLWPAYQPFQGNQSRGHTLV
jgi:hypothetical protein